MADTRNVTNWIWGLVATLLLFVVAAHAVAPVTQAHGQGRGSAFSASTAEVSLQAGSRALVTKAAVRLDPLGPVPTLLMFAAETVTRPARPAASYRPAMISRIAETALGPISPRAPPMA
jgi:hypothetical protein